MEKKINIITLIFILLLVFILNPTSAQCDSIKNLINNQDFCHNKSVNYVFGIVKESIDQNFFIIYDLSDKNYELIIGNKDNMSYYLEDGDVISVDGVYLKTANEERNMIVTANDRLYVMILGKNFQEIANSFLSLEHNLVYIKKVNLILLILSPLLILFAFYFGYNRYIIKKWKGKAFEGYVEKLFTKETWKLIEDNSFRKLKRWTESYNNPDFIFRHKEKNKEVGVECKYISSMYKGITWAYEDQIKNYNNFSNKRNIPVYIIIGVGGRPNNPKELFLLQLKSLKYPYIKRDYLTKFKRNSKEEFDLGLDGYLK